MLESLEGEEMKQQPQDWTKTDHYYIALSIAQQYRSRKSTVYGYRNDASIIFSHVTVMVYDKGRISIFANSDQSRALLMDRVDISIADPNAIPMTIEAINKIYKALRAVELRVLKSAIFGVSWIILLNWFVQDLDKFIPWVTSLVKGL